MKIPEAGKVKTRLAAGVGEAGAAALYRAMAEETVRRMEPLAGRVRVVIAYEPPGEGLRVRDWLKGAFGYVPQEGHGLGERLSRAALWAFRQGARRVVIIGSDCPDLDCGDVEKALRRLRGVDVILGPAVDGGYYLVGLGRAGAVSIFKGIPWSTPRVFEESLKRIRARRFTYEILDFKRDIDTVDDLRACRWKRARASV